MLVAVVASATPALIPTPRTVEWTADSFDASRFTITGPVEAGFAIAELEQILMASGGRTNDGFGKLDLQLGETGSQSPESYSIVVAATSVTVTACQPVGLVYGVQTLSQLVATQDGRPVIAGCRITDEPAFAWRGFMHDVGRNFQDLTLLKRFVDVMARYKMNVFHFHLTDNPAWRIECRVHPELNSPTNTPGSLRTTSGSP